MRFNIGGKGEYLPLSVGCSNIAAHKAFDYCIEQFSTKYPKAMARRLIRNQKLVDFFALAGLPPTHSIIFTMKKKYGETYFIIF